MNKDQAKEKLKQLIDKFTSQFEYYKSTNYNETQTRRDFIDPFFAAYFLKKIIIKGIKPAKYI